MSEERATRLRKIVAGGQTGVDWAALTAAARVGLETGGWCPLDCTDEDGPINGLEQWGLAPVTDPIWEEHREQFESLGLLYEDSDKWARRTLMNTLQSSGTLTILPNSVKDGTNLGMEAAKALGKPLLIVRLLDHHADRQAVEEWLRKHELEIVNVNGPRESSSPGIRATCLPIFEQWFAAFAHGVHRQGQGQVSADGALQCS
mmetsp:Transcript_106298/g.295749  ORF Transcript_106298/g.295749 Transcript_106298/m.295749 type:complete len:203 (-) Transcript_106298:31-639(-)